jgi:D-lactate dehydrogenase (cytochrome)
VQDIARDNGGQDFEWATRPEDRSRLWQARHDVLFACLNLLPGSRGISTDVCVPISRLAEAIAGTQQDIAASGLIAPIVGHVGDGNFHVVILTTPDDPAQVRAAEALGQRIVEARSALDGTCTGEHGIGIGKREFPRRTAKAWPMRSLKATLDPLLMNPGKIFTLPD